MRSEILLYSFLVTSVAAQYFSAGWQPGQSQRIPSAPSYSQPQSFPSLAKPIDTESAKPTSLLNFNLLQTFTRITGINLTQNDEGVWNSQIPLITDENFKSLIVDENLTTEEEDTRVWVLEITVPSSQGKTITKHFDQQFDEAYNMSQTAGDLPNVRWGRVNYLNVTSITTRWGIWTIPYLVILKDRGKSLRFYRAQQIRLTPETLREFLKTEGWRASPAWSSNFAPGGKWAYVLEWLAIFFSNVYAVTAYVPSWLLVLITGSLTSVVVNALHSSSPRKETNITAVSTTEKTSVDEQGSKSNSSNEIAKESKKHKKSSSKSKG